MTPAEAKVKHHLFPVRDYYRMAEAGILGEDDRVELIEGEIIEMPPTGSPHAGVVKSLISRLRHLPDERAMFNVQDPLHGDEHSEPEPDFMLLRPRADSYRGSHPTAGDVLLLVEVWDSTLQFDRQVKIPLYARAGVPEVWTVDVQAEAVEIYRQPRPSGNYEEQRTRRRGQELSPGALPAVRLRVNDLLGSA